MTSDVAAPPAGSAPAGGPPAGSADVQRQITALEHARNLLSHASTCHHDDLLGCPGFQEWFAAYLESAPPAARPATPVPSARPAR